MLSTCVEVTAIVGHVHVRGVPINVDFRASITRLSLIYRLIPWSLLRLSPRSRLLILWIRSGGVKV